MENLAAKHATLIAVLALATSKATCNGLDDPPTILQVPVLDIRYEIAATNFEALPADITDLCDTDHEYRGRYFIFANIRDGARSYYLIGGYGVRPPPELPGHPRYYPYDFGTVYFIEGKRCEEVGDAIPVFEDGATEQDLSQSTLTRLAKDFAVRLEHGFGGKDRLRAELRNQHVDFKRLTTELQKAFYPYFLHVP
ncbi:MAG: hypothetical protein V4582_17850 [Pseudomonadota bacterium]